MDDLVKRLRIGIHTSADEQALRDEAADRIEALETAFSELMKAWEFWQSQETKNGFPELCAAYWDAKAALGEKKDG